MSTLTNSAKLGLIVAGTVLDAIRSQLVDDGKCIQFELNGEIINDLITADVSEHVDGDVEALVTVIHTCIKDFATSKLCMAAIVKEDWDLIIFAFAARVSSVCKAMEVKVKPITWGNDHTVPSPKTA